MSASDLEQRIAQLEDIEAIKKLKANYCLHVDHANEEGWVSLSPRTRSGTPTSSAATKGAKRSAACSGRFPRCSTSPSTM